VLVANLSNAFWGHAWSQRTNPRDPWAKVDNIWQVGWAVTFGIRADLTGCLVVPTGLSGSLRG